MDNARKARADTNFSVCLVYPNAQSVGIINLGFQKIYAAISALENVFCDIAFLPEKSGATVSVYEKRRLADFDILAFSVTFEMDATNILKILGNAGVQLESKNRESSHPLVCAGGVAVTLNPEPLSDFIDFFVIGEGEVLIGKLLNLLRNSRNSPRHDRLLGIACLPGVYVPSLYDVQYDVGKISSRKAKSEAPNIITRQYNHDYEKNGMAQYIAPDGAIFKDTFLIESGKGCGQGCRFCAAGFVYRPVRHVETETLKKQISRGLKKNSRIGLVGSAVCDHPEINDIYDYILDLGGLVTVSSLRAGKVDKKTFLRLRKGGCRSVTMAPEAGSAKLRRAINKEITDEQIIETVSQAAMAGILNIKLYFLAGLPGETDEDISAIADLAKKMRDAFVKSSKPFGRAGKITVCVNPFVPKPHTPFQWEPFAPMAGLKKKIRFIRRALAGQPNITLKTESVKNAATQALLSVGTRRVGAMILDVFNGKSWSDVLRLPEAKSIYAREKEKEEKLPWDFLDNVVTKQYLWKEREKSKTFKTTAPCPAPHSACRKCGVFKKNCL